MATTCFVVLWLVYLMSMLHSEGFAQADHQAARIATAALLATVGQATRSTGDRWLLLPDSVELTQEQLIDRLAGAPKPLACQVTAHGKIPALTCTAMKPGGALTHHLRHASMTIMNLYEGLRREGELVESDPLVLVRTVDGGLTVRMSVVERCIRDYSIADHILYLYDADDEARAHGAAGVIAFGGSSDVPFYLDFE